MNVRVWRADGRLDGVHRTGAEVRDLLSAAAVPPTVELFPRSDGPGSSQDLLQFIAAGSRIWHGKMDFADPSWSWSDGSLRTPGACIGSEPMRFRLVKASREDAVEYFSPDFHTAALVSDAIVPGVPEQFVNNILIQFGLTGVRVEADPMPAVYRGTGLGGSNLAHGAAVILASAASGADLSLAQIYIWATLLENNFGVRVSPHNEVSYGVSLTGGQELLTALQGGVYDNLHVPFFLGPHAVVSRELVSPSDYATLEAHLALVNTGQRRTAQQTSAGVNSEWMKAWMDPRMAGLHLKKAGLAYRGAEALRLLDFATYAEVIRDYRDIRCQLCSSYVAGQQELEDLCAELEAEYFPVGAGSGTCLVCAEDPASLVELTRRVVETEDPASGRAVLPFKVRERGVSFSGFAESGLSIPAYPGDANRAP